MLPIASIAGRPNPRISSPYGPAPARASGFHNGEDWTFPRVSGDPPYESDNPRGSKGFYNPPGAMAVATMPGTVQYSERQASGIVVRMRHAAYDTLYLHLRSSFVSAGQRVSPGTPIGEIGGDPRAGKGSPFGRDPFTGDVYGFIHLHREFQSFDRMVLAPSNLPRDTSVASGPDNGAQFSVGDWLNGLGGAENDGATIALALAGALAIAWAIS